MARQQSDEIPLAEAIRLAQQSGIIPNTSTPSQTVRQRAKANPITPLVDRIPSELDGVSIQEYTYEDEHGIAPEDEDEYLDDEEEEAEEENSETSTRRYAEGIRRPAQKQEIQVVLPELWDNIFNTALFGIPLSSLYLLLDM